jgi:hypothetical protein
MSTFHWSLVDFDDEPPKTRPPALTVRQELDRPSGNAGGLNPEPKRRGWPKGKPRKQPE